MKPAGRDIRYVAEPTANDFHNSNAFVRGIRGPLGSGKSSMCTVELLRRAMAQEACEGVRYSRWAIIRNTFPQLRDTTLNTFRDWIPEEICHVNMQPPFIGRLRMPLDDSTRIDSEFIFLALDREEDVVKLKSLELTGAWINEACEIHKAVFDMAVGRVARYPPERLGWPTWSGVILDTNPPDDDSWWYNFAEVEKPRGYEFFVQPPALLEIPPKKKGDMSIWVPNMGQSNYSRAENITQLKLGFNYYQNQVPGKTREWIRVFIQGHYGSSIEGKPIYPEYNDDTHVSKEPLKPMRGLPLIVGIDFGLTPAAIFCQLTLQGQVRILSELCAIDSGIRRFARDALIPYIRSQYHDMTLEYVSDPAGSQRGQTDEATCIEILREEGIHAEMADSNLFARRREAVAKALTTMIDGAPGFLLDPTCKTLRKGFLGGYRYRRMRLQTGESYANEAEKNKFSHPHDALQYAAMRMVHGSGDTIRDQSQYQGGSSEARPVEVESPEGWV